MKYLKSMIVILVFLSVQSAFSQAKSDSLHKNVYDTTNYTKMRDSLVQVYAKQNKEYEKKMQEQKDKQKNNQRGLGSSFFGLNMDLIFGVGFSNTKFDVNNDSSGLSNTASKTGPLAGLNINFNLLGFSLGTGFSYSSKGFTTNNSNSFSSNYINIPLMFAFNFDINRVRLDIAAGPYIGIILSQDKSQQYSMKNIDLGIVGTLQGTYFFNRFLGTLLGVKYEQGGLNNLLQTTSGSNNNVTSIKTTNWFIYTGIKFVL